MKNIFSVISCVFFLFGCQKPSGRWEVVKETPVFKKADEADEIHYVLEKGEVCALGVEQVVKVFMYRQVSCPKGEGWIRYDGGYPVRRID